MVFVVKLVAQPIYFHLHPVVPQHMEEQRMSSYRPYPHMSFRHSDVHISFGKSEQQWFVVNGSESLHRSLSVL
jgi:hypothetical protein